MVSDFDPEDTSGNIEQLQTSESASGYYSKHNLPLVTSDASPNPIWALLCHKMPERLISQLLMT